MGIINSKENIFDIILTDLALENILNKGLDIKYYSFSDTEVSYNDLELDSTEIPSSKIILESSFSPNDSGLPKYLGDNTSAHFKLNDIVLDSKFVNGQIYFNGQPFIGSNNLIAKTLFENFLENLNEEFKSKSSLFTLLEDFENEDFILSTGSIAFTVPSIPFLHLNENGNMERLFPDLTVNENIETNFPKEILTDGRFVNEDNFDKLIPFFKGANNSEVKLLTNGNISNPKEVITTSRILNKLNAIKEKGFSREINFIETSSANNLVFQFFSYSSDDGIGNEKNTFTQLSIIDFGIINFGGIYKKVLFVGKVLKRSDNNFYFSNIFTVLLRVWL